MLPLSEARGPTGPGGWTPKLSSETFRLSAGATELGLLFDVSDRRPECSMSRPGTLTGRRPVMDRRSIVLKIPFIGVATGVASLVLFAGAASAHTAQASVTRECAPERAESATIARVTIQ